jgi:hypothetical protein
LAEPLAAGSQARPSWANDGALPRAGSENPLCAMSGSGAVAGRG